MSASSGRGLAPLLACAAALGLFVGASTASSAPRSGPPVPTLSVSGEQPSGTASVEFARLERAFEGRLDRDAVRRLRIETRLARQATQNDDLAQASALLDAIDDTVETLRDEQRISDRHAAEILAAVGDVEDVLAARVTASR